MARKEDAGLMEKHLEKVVLGVAAVILIVAGMHWGLGSPRRIKLDLNARGISMPQKEYSPDEIDGALEEASTKLGILLEKKKVVVKPLPAYVRRLKKIYENPYDDRYVHRYVNVGPGRVPLKGVISGRKIKPVRLADLMPLPKPEKPIIKACREVQVIPTPDGEPKYKEVDVVAHGAIVFGYDKVLKDWKKALEKTHVSARVVFAAVETQRRYQLPDGSWSKPEPVALVVMPNAPSLPVIPAPDEKNLLEIQQKIDELAWISNQEYILQSPYYDIIWPDQRTGTWQIDNHKPRTRVSDLLEQEGEKPAGTGMPMVKPEGGTAAERREAAKREAARREAARREAARREAARREAARREAARRTGRSGARERPPGMGMPGMGPPEMGRPGMGLPGMERPGMERPGMGLPGERRPGEKRPKPIRRPVEIDAPMLVLIPTLQEQLDNPAGILESWFHDTSLTEGMTYSYRLRLALVNPLLGRFRYVADKDDAKIQALNTPWSDWSESVEVKRPTEFFLVGSAPPKMVVVEVFTQRWGQRVSHRFPVSQGEPIGGDESKELLRLGTGELVKTVVSFKTGVIAVSFDFKKRQRVPGTNSFRTTTTEMLYLDAAGKLRTRTQIADESSQRYKDLLKEVRQATGATVDVR